MRVFYNGKFVSCEDENRVFSVLAENKGRILYTGDEIPARYRNAPALDMRGACIVPAFCDTHMHFESYALFSSTVDVRDAKDFAELGELLRAYLARNPKAKFIPAYGCSAHTVAEGRLPERDDLDKMVSVPLMIVKYDGHAAVANSALINTFPKNVTEDPGFNKKTGWLYQNAFYNGVNFITAKVNVVSLLSGMSNAAHGLAKKGLGLIHTVEGVGYKNDIDVDTIRFVRYGFPSCYRVYFQTMDVDKVLKRKMKGIGGCFSLALDGCFGSEDAALTAPYANNKDNTGFLAYTQQQVNDFCIKANRAGLQITMHAIGDAAVEQALVAYETALADYPRADHRHIIIHADLITPEQQSRAAKLGLTVALQPVFLRWKQEPDSYLTRILGDRADRILPMKSMLDKGILLTAGSDAPCTLPDPIESIWNCVDHPNPAERVSMLDALRMHTAWAAKSSFDENIRGTLREGLLADFAVLSGDILETAPSDVRSIHVVDTYLQGRRVGDRAPGALGLVCRSVGGWFGRKQFN
ncbi:MAG: amidohydrolase family protein [Oscillospiraceae bacterium]|nr:amidohydrolase family protein [Oscillospiraceae bacterium]